jgi:hypothetical protein
VKFFLIIALLLSTTHQLLSQKLFPPKTLYDNYYSQLKNKDAGYPPFQFELSAGIPIPFNSKNFYTFEFFGSINFDVSHRKYFLKVGYGIININKELNNEFNNFLTSANHLLLGFSYFILGIGKYPVFADIGYSIIINKKNGFNSGLSLGVSSSIPIHDIIFISPKIGFPILQSSYQDEYYFNPFISFGIQIF